MITVLTPVKKIGKESSKNEEWGLSDCQFKNCTSKEIWEDSGGSRNFERRAP
jgi:hypothetical protein